MKKKLSIWMLCAGSTVNKLLGLLVLMAAGTAGLGFWTARRMADQQIMAGPEQLFADGHIAILFLVSFLLWTAVLIMPDHAKAGYTLDRLRVTPKTVLLIQSLYNILSYVVLWGAQVLLLIALFRWYGSTLAPEYFGPQSVMLAFYRDNILHSLLPLAEWNRYVRDLVILAGVGTAAAVVSRGIRWSYGWLVSMLVLIVGLMIWFPSEIGAVGRDVFVSAGVLLYVGIMVCALRPRLEREEQNG